MEENWKAYIRYKKDNKNQDTGRGEGMVISHMSHINIKRGKQAKIYVEGIDS